MIDHIRLAQVRSVLLPHMANLVAAFRFSVMVNNQNHNYYLTNIGAGTLFGGIDEVVYARVRELFANKQEVVVDKHSGQNFIRVADRIVLRVKHFDRNFHPRNARTRHNTQWVNQYPMPGMPQAERLDFGYRMDALGIDVQDAFVALRTGRNLLWIWQVLGEQISTPTTQLTLRPGYRLSEPNFAYDDFGR